MSGLINLREGLKRFYASYSLYINKAFQFVLGLLIFWGISRSIGYWSLISSGLVVLGGALVCTFLPVNFTLFVSAVMILGNLYKLSLPALAIAGVAIVILFIIYLRFTPKYGFVVLLVPICCTLKISCVIPLALGLACAPIAAIPAGIGVFMYYMVNSISNADHAAEGSAEMMALLTSYGKSIFANKEMWLTVIVFAVVIIAVYFIRRSSINYNWVIAIVVGLVLDIVLSIVVGSVLDVDLGIGLLLLGGIAAAVVAVVLHWMLFTVNYSGSKKVQFEDDDYYYYVKAVPKITDTALDKRLKKFMSDSEVSRDSGNNERAYSQNQVEQEYDYQDSYDYEDDSDDYGDDYEFDDDEFTDEYDFGNEDFSEQ